ncbi:MAG: tRNA nucleotidyltransferase [Candidatus Magasanikbacteria bacterium]|nr:tRNA nucleotidyltransferase [Candidatus Magasanikbacteria bacterium]
MIIEKELFNTIYTVSEALSIEVYVVGGYVRDSLLGVPPKKDIDIVVGGSGLVFAKAFAKHVGEEVGSLVEFPDFDTARFVFTKENEDGKKTALFELEFAGARKEVYDEHSRKPKVEATTIEGDLSRRDFTVNAMAQKITKNGLGEIVDPFSGQKDVQEKILRTPLDPGITFADDPLRMLRAARFASQLNFDIEKTAIAAMNANRKRLNIVSKERIQEEFLKLLGTPKPSIGIGYVYATKVLDEFLPEVRELSGVEEVKGYKHKDNLSHTLAVVDNVAELSPKPLLRLAGLLHDIAKPQTKKLIPGRGWTFDMHEHLGRKMAKDICRRLKMSRDDTYYVTELVRWHLQPIALMDEGVTDSAVRRLIINLQERLGDLLLLCKADITTGNQKKKARRLKNYDNIEKRIAAVEEIDALRAFQSPVRGEEIMKECGLKPGPTVGKIKEDIEEAILEGRIENKYEAAKVYFNNIKDVYMAKASDWEKKG